MSGSIPTAPVGARISEIHQRLGATGGTTPTAAGARDVGGGSFASILLDASVDATATAPTAAPQVAGGSSRPSGSSGSPSTTVMFPITPGMTARQRAGVYVSRLTYAQAHGGLTAFQRAELAKYSAMVAVRGSAEAPGTAAKATTPAAAPTSAPPPAVAPGTTSRIDGQTYLNLGSFTSPAGDYVAGGTWISLSSPSSDTYGLLQQLLAVQADPSLLEGSPLGARSMFSDPMQRAAQIAELGGSILANGPAYYGAYSGFSGAQIQQIAKAAQTAAAINLNPALAAAIDHAAAVTPADAPASAPLAAASIAQAVANVATISVGSYGSLSVSSLPPGTAPQYAGSPAAAPTGSPPPAATPSGGSA